MSYVPFLKGTFICSRSECRRGGTPTTDSCNFDLTTDLILSTISVHSYNFIFPNVGVGVYTVATMFDQISLSSSFGAYSCPWRSYVTH
jgi:hypothetical protein